MKKYLILLITLFTLFSCADPQGLHNQEASSVIIKLENIPVSDGIFSIPGEHQSTEWDNTTEDVIITDGSGETEVYLITKSSFQFSLVPVESWDRPWYPEMKANFYDYASGGKQWNFQVVGMPLGKEVLITIDGSTTPATITVE